MISTWHAPLRDGTTREELMLSFAQGRDVRVLVLPALFDEANKLRRLTVDTMRALNSLGVDTFLPDWPGCNESLAPLADQTLESWGDAAVAAARAIDATHVFAIRAGALLATPGLRGLLYAPQSGAKTLRAMIRARAIAAREAGRTETSEALYELGRSCGITLAGWEVGAAMFRALEDAEFPAESADGYTVIAQSELPGPGLWLRAEPAHDDAQARALAERIANAL
jgi:hypothetical protein